VSTVQIKAGALFRAAEAYLLAPFFSGRRRGDNVNGGQIQCAPRHLEKKDLRGKLDLFPFIT
jgi:hypothetical protein